MPRRSPRWVPNPRWLVASLALVLALAVPAAYLAMPGIYRWHRLNQLTATDPAARERALNYIIRHADDEPAVRDGAIRALDRAAERDRFIELVNALDHAGVWSRPYVDDAHWLRWLGVLAASPGADARRLAATHLAELTDLAQGAQREALLEPLESLLDDEDGAVRHDALHTTALLRSYADDRADFERLIAARTTDAAPSVARDAWIQLGLIGPVAGQQANWREAPPKVAEALLWAAVRTDPQHPQPALDALRDLDAPAAARAMAAYALHRSDTPRAPRALYDLLAQRPIAHEPGPARTALQRAILAAPLPSRSMNANDGDIDQTDARSEGEHLLDRLCTDLEKLAADASAPMRPLLAACRFRAPPAMRGDLVHLLDDLQAQPPLLLAQLEGMPADVHEIPITRAHPAMVRLIATARTTSPDIDVIEDLFSHERAPVRDLACTIAARRLDDAQLDALIESLLTDLNDEARISGAILAGLTGLHIDLLRELTSGQRDWRVQTLMEVGLWMREGGERVSRRMPGLLMREDLPMSTLLLALLHRRDARGLDFLLAPHGEPAPDLHRLLVHYRWWHVLADHLPADAPPLWLWGDPALQRFQIDVLRNWYRLHRADLTQATGDG